MGGVIRPPKPPAPPPAPAYVAPSKPEISQATAGESINRGQGRSSMILTGPSGLGSGDLKLRKKTLLG